jgi:hypothetical protein
MADYEITSPVDIVGTLADPGKILLTNGTNSTTVRASSSLASNTSFILPSSDGITDQVIKWGSSGETEWTTLELASLGITKIVFVETLADFPAPVGGIITLVSGITYYVIANVNIGTNRIVVSTDNTIIGSSFKTSSLTSTTTGNMLTITSSFALRFIKLSAPSGTIVDVDATGDPMGRFVWQSVYFTGGTIGTIKNCQIFAGISLAGDALTNGFTFDGSISTILFFLAAFSTTAGTIIKLNSTCVVAATFRIFHSTFVVTGTGINVDPAATIPAESYLLDSNIFAGPGTRIAGITYLNNVTLFKFNTGIENTSVMSQMFMSGNATVTGVAATSTFYKALGTTTPNALNQKFTHTNNRLQYTGAFHDHFRVTCTVTLTSGASNNINIGIYNSHISAVESQSVQSSTTNGAGRSENVTILAILEMNPGDYIEVHVANSTTTTNITVIDMNAIINSVK